MASADTVLFRDFESKVDPDVVKVDRIEINYSGASWDDVTEETIVVLKGTKYTFKAFPDPSGASWPTDQPDWYAAGGGTTRVEDGDETEVTFTSSGTKTLSAKCGGPGHCGTDPGKSVTINVVVPEPDQIYFVDYTIGEEHNIYNVTDPVWKRVSNPNDPASYTKNKHVRVRAKFWASENLTYNTQVYVDVAGIDWLTFTEDTSVDFWSWPSESTFHNSDGLLADTIGSTVPNFAWTYKVPSGTNTWIPMAADSGPHKIFRVYDSPLCADSLYVEANLDTCVGWADGCTKVDTSNDSSNVPRKVQLGAKGWCSSYGIEPGTGIEEDPFTSIPENGGDCETYADLMTKGLYILGVTASNERIECMVGDTLHWFFKVGDTPCWVNDTGDCDGDGTLNRDEEGYPGTLEGIYVPADTGEVWPFHAACSCAGHWWEITWNTTPDHDTEANMCDHPNGPVILRQGHLPGGSL